MAKGYGYGAEGDALTAALMVAARDLLGDTQFTEMYAMDFPTRLDPDEPHGRGQLGARARRPPGAADQAPARDRRRSTTRRRSCSSTRRARRRSPRSCRSAASASGSSSPRARSSTPRSCPALEMPYGFFRPDTGVRACMDAWLRLGGPHHQVLNPGRHADAWRVFCGWPAWSSRRCRAMTGARAAPARTELALEDRRQRGGRDHGRRRAALLDRRRARAARHRGRRRARRRLPREGARALAEPAARRALRLRRGRAPDRAD